MGGSPGDICQTPLVQIHHNEREPYIVSLRSAFNSGDRPDHGKTILIERFKPIPRLISCSVLHDGIDRVINARLGQLRIVSLPGLALGSRATPQLGQ